VGRLDGKVAIISGGARGQGESEVRRFADEGASVVFGDMRDDLGRQVASDVGDRAIYQHLDVRSEDDWQHIVQKAEGEFGKVDVLVNNAGVAQIGPITHEVPLADYMTLISINQVGVFLGMRAVIPAMLRNRGGSIVNISSTAGLAGYGGTVAYTASKFAVRGMTKTVALEYGRAGIRVNSIHPGGIDTPMSRALSGNGEVDGDSYQGMAMGRVGQPEEIANLALFLASDESSYCTGSEFTADGGLMAGMVNPSARALLD